MALSGAWIDIFKPNTENIQTFVLSKLLQPTFELHVLIVGDPNVPHKAKVNLAAILKIEKNRGISTTI